MKKVIDKHVEILVKDVTDKGKKYCKKLKSNRTIHIRNYYFNCLLIGGMPKCNAIERLSYGSFRYTKKTSTDGGWHRVFDIIKR